MKHLVVEIENGKKLGVYITEVQDGITLEQIEEQCRKIYHLGEAYHLTAINIISQQMFEDIIKDLDKQGKDQSNIKYN
jgi:hypothetical protein